MMKEAVRTNDSKYDPKWSQSIAVGPKDFIDRVESELGSASEHRKIVRTEEGFSLKEPELAYSAHFGPQNMLHVGEICEIQGLTD